MKKWMLSLTAALLFCGVGSAQVNNSSDAGRASINFGYDTLDYSNLYMGLNLPVIAKPGSTHLPFSYSVVGLPNVMPGVWGQSNANLTIPYPLYGGIGYSTAQYLCPEGSNHVFTAQYSNFSYVDTSGASYSFGLPTPFQITATSLTSNVLTITAANTVQAGDSVQIYAQEAFLQGIQATVLATGLSSTQFQIAETGQSNYTNNSDSGTVQQLTGPACINSTDTYQTSDGSLTLKVSVNSSFAMTYTLTNPSGDEIIPSGRGGGLITTGWAASTNVGLNAMLYDSHGNAQITTACANYTCTTGTSAPTFNATVGGTTTDGKLTWTNLGPPAGKIVDVAGNTSSVAITNLTGHTQGGSGTYANAGRDYSQPQVWTYTDAMNLNPLTVTNPALTTSGGALLSTVQTAMAYKDDSGTTQNVYLNQSQMSVTPINANCLSSLQGPPIVGVNSTLDSSGVLHGTSFANPTPYPFFPTSLQYPDGSQIGFQYESVLGNPAGNTTVNAVAVSNNIATLYLNSDTTVSQGAPITEIVASGGSANPSVVVTVSGTNPWTVGKSGTIQFMSAANMEWDGVPFTVTSRTSTTFTFVYNYCQLFTVNCLGTMTFNETQGQSVGYYGNLTLSGLVGASFLNGTTVPSNSFPSVVPVTSVVVTNRIPQFYYSANANGTASNGWTPVIGQSVTLSNMANGQFNTTNTVSNYYFTYGNGTYNWYFTLNGTYTNGSYQEQGVSIPTALLGTHFLQYPYTHADYGKTNDSGTLTNAGISASTTGRLSQITLPTGGTIKYAYSGGTNGSGINCQDESNATIKRTTPDGATTYTHTPSGAITNVSSIGSNQEFGIFNLAGLWGYGQKTTVPYEYILTPVTQGTLTNLQITGTANHYTVVATFTNGKPALVSGNNVFIYAPGTPVYTGSITIASVTANTITSTVGGWAGGTYNSSVSGYITTGLAYNTSQYIDSGLTTGQWASLSTVGSSNSVTTVIDPAANETQYTFAGLHQVSKLSFKGTPTTSLLNAGFETGTLANWQSVVVGGGIIPQSGTCTVPYCGVTYTDMGSATLTDPWQMNASTGVLDAYIGVVGVAGCCNSTPASDNVSSVQVSQINGAWALTVTFATPFTNILLGAQGTQFTFSGLTTATWLNSKVLTAKTWDGQKVLTFAPPSGAPEPYALASDTGLVNYVEGSTTGAVYATDWQYLTNFSISTVNVGDALTGIEFYTKIEFGSTATSTITAQLANNGVLIGTPKTCNPNIQDGFAVCDFGSSTDVWGTSGVTWGPGVGIAISAGNLSGGNGESYVLCCVNATYYTLTVYGNESTSAEWSVTSAASQGGTYSATINTGVDTQLFALTSLGSQYFPVNPGDLIQYGGYFLRGNNNSANLWWTCAFYDTNQNFISQCPNAGPFGGPAPTTWTNYQNIAAAPSNAVYATFYAEINGNERYGGLVYADSATFVDLTTNNLLAETINCYNSPFYGPGSGVNPEQTCLQSPPISTNSPITQFDTYLYDPGNLIGPAIVRESFDRFGRITDVKSYDFGATVNAFTSDEQLTYGTYNGTLTTTASPSNCVPMTNVAITGAVCEDLAVNSSGNTISEMVYQYNANGTASAVNVVDALDNKNFVTKYTYSSNGSLLTVTEPNTETITAVYGNCNSLLPSTLSDTLFSLTLAESCKSGELSSLTDPNSNVWTWTYADPLFRLTSETTPLTTGTYTDSTAHTYTPTSVDTKMTFNSGNTVTEHLVTSDPSGRISLDQQAFSSGQYMTKQRGYNSRGLLSSVSMPFLSPAGTTGTGLTNVTYTYDAVGRVLTETEENGANTTFTYLGRDTYVSESGLNARQFESNAFGQTVSLCEVTGLSGSGPCGQDTARTGFLTTYTYNSASQLIGIVQNAQSSTPHTIDITYDGIGRMRTIARSETGTITLTYDSDPASVCSASTGNIVRVDDNARNVICETYDLHNRLITESYASGPNSSGTSQKNYVYDSSSTFTCPNGANQKGRMAEAYTGTSTSKIVDEGYCYSKRGDITDIFESTPHSGGAFHTKATYWPDGSINTLSGIPGISTTLTYNMGYSNTSSITGQGGTLISSLQESLSSTGASPSNAVTLGNGDTDTYNFDAKQSFTGFTSVVGGTTVSNTWARNTSGTPSTLTVVNPFDTTAPNHTCSYGWDGFARITGYGCTNGSTDLWGQNFAYDIFGNVKKTLKSGYSGQVWSPTYSTANNQYTGSPYTYDADGHITNDSFNTYVWGADGKIQSLTNISSGVTTSFTYDASGNLVEESSSNLAGHTQYVYSPVGKVATTTSTN